MDHILEKCEKIPYPHEKEKNNLALLKHYIGTIKFCPHFYLHFLGVSYSLEMCNVFLKFLRKFQINLFTFTAKTFVGKFDIYWPDIALISVRNDFGWRHTAKWSCLSISTLKIDHKTFVHIPCHFYFQWHFETWPWPRSIWPLYSFGTLLWQILELQLSLSSVRPVYYQFQPRGDLFFGDIF